MSPFQAGKVFKLKLEDPESEATCTVPAKEGELMTCRFTPKNKPQKYKPYKIKKEQEIEGTTYEVQGELEIKAP